MLGAAAGFVVGGLLHPQEDEALTGLVQTGAWLGDPAWVPSHLLLLVAEVLLIVGLLGLVTGHPDLGVSARRAGWVALAAAALWVVEGVPHVLAAGDAHAVTGGHHAPFFSVFQQVAPLIYPIVGLSVGALATLGRGRLTHPIFAVAGVVGGGAYALGPLLEGLGGIDEVDFLYPLGLLMAVWFAAVGATELMRRRNATGERAPQVSG